MLQKYSWAKKKTATHVTCTFCNFDINFVNMGEVAPREQEKSNEKAPIKYQRIMENREKVNDSLSVLHFVDLTSQVQSPPAPTSALNSSFEDSQSPQLCSESPANASYVEDCSRTESNCQSFSSIQSCDR